MQSRMSCNNIDKMKYVGQLVLSVWRLLVYYRAYVNVPKICCASEVFEQAQIAILSYLLIFVYSCLIFKVHTLNCCNQSFISFFFEIKGRSTVILYKNEKHSYITRRSMHTTQTDAYNTTLHHYHLGEELKTSRRAASSSLTLCHTKSCGPLQAQATT